MECVSELSSIIDHVFLPPQLPQEEQLCDIPLVQWALTSLASLPRKPKEPCVALDRALGLLGNLQTVNSLLDGHVNDSALQKALLALKEGNMLPVNVRAQNAAIMITRENEKLIFETFELSPPNESVITTKCRLVRTFPANAVAVDAFLLRTGDFAATVTQTLSKMSRQAVASMQPQSVKAGAHQGEIRDTAHPGIVTELFVGGFLGSFGTTAAMSAISKNTREEILWKDTLSPWRRSPTWLLIRVALQLSTMRSPGGSRVLYKYFMINIMSTILDMARRDPSLPSDIIFVMSAKITRRLQKLTKESAGVEAATDMETALCSRVVLNARETLRKAAEIVSQRWDAIQGEPPLSWPSSLRNLDVEKDVATANLALDAHIGNMSSRREAHGPAVVFKPYSELVSYPAELLPHLPKANAKNAYYAAGNLQRFEQWVADHLAKWEAAHAGDDPGQQLHDLCTQYHSLASALYSGNPEGLSIMILTTFELWVACDRAAIRSCKIIREYDPGIPTGVLQNLLLPCKADLQRLKAIEAHLSHRSKAKHPTCLLFSMHTGNSLAVRLFDRSAQHQRLLDEIVARAERDIELKKAEFAQVAGRYIRLEEKINKLSCTFVTLFHIDDRTGQPFTEQKHAQDCERCRLWGILSAISIRVFERPLPWNGTEAKCVVFELQTPSWLASWRNARCFLLQTVLQGELKRSNLGAKRLLSDDPHLAVHNVPGISRITLLSQSKPVVHSHYKTLWDIGYWSEKDVIRPNGLRYAYYDSLSAAFVGEGQVDFTERVAKTCTYALPEDCTHIQQYLHRPSTAPDGPGPNAVIASQHQCPPSMTLEEYRDLSNVPLGRWTQWPHMITQLAMPTVDFKKIETNLVFLQCINQAGPPSGDTLRHAHAILGEDVSAILGALSLALNRVEKNWDSAQAVDLFATMAARVLSVSDDRHVQQSCLLLLEKARRASFGWIYDLRAKASAEVVDADRAESILKSVEVALICAGTFDVDSPHLESILATVGDTSTLIQCSIIVHEGEQNLPKTEYFNLLRRRFKRLLLRSYPSLIKNEDGIDRAVRAAWSAYLPGHDGWQPASASIDHWITTQTEGSANSSMRVHCNLLSGEFLVNGRPLNQPPESYQKDSLYTVLFGSAIVEVMPAQIPGFQFSAKREFGGFTVFLGLEHDALLVQILRGTQNYEVLPSHLFDGVFPDHFVEDYVHWYDLSTGSVEFLPIRDAWNLGSAAIWTLRRSPEQTSWFLEKDGDRLLSLKSETARVISTILSPLTEPEMVHSILRPSTHSSPTLAVDLPNLRLGFSLQKGSSLLESREFRSMSVDHDQILGTLVGFHNRLILRSSASLRPPGSSLQQGTPLADSTHSCSTSNGHDGFSRTSANLRDRPLERSGVATKRVLLVPESKVSYRRNDGHVTVDISKAAVSKVYHLGVNTELGQLQDNGEIGCKLYLAYLHALTSYCLPDPLTKRTGTEQAIAILFSAATRSFSRLSQDQIDLLAKIAALSPGRCYYPTHLKIMQTVTWNPNLSFLSQHSWLGGAVQGIYKQSQRSNVFHPGHGLHYPTLGFADNHLRERDDVRSCAFRTPDSGAAHSIEGSDRDYASRDSGVGSDRARNALVLSSLVYRGEASIHWTPFDPSSERLWKIMETGQVVHGPNVAMDAVKYDAALITDDSCKAAMKTLPAFHNWLVTDMNAKRAKFSTMMWLASFSFASNADMVALQVLAALSTSKPPTIVTSGVQQFHPLEGRACTEAMIKEMVDQNLRLYSDCPEYSDVGRPDTETERSWVLRRARVWVNNKVKAVSLLVDAVFSQWPCEVLRKPDIKGPVNVAAYINVDAVYEQAAHKLGVCYNNSILHSYLGDIEQVVSGLPIKAAMYIWPSVKTPPDFPSRCGHIDAATLFAGRAPIVVSSDQTTALQSMDASHTALAQPTVPLLASLITALETGASTGHERRYNEDLKQSLAALVSGDRPPSSFDTSPELLSAHLQQCENRVREMYLLLVAAVELAAGPYMSSLHGPRVSPILFLQQLARARWDRLAADWQRCIVTYGTALTELHHARRLEQLADQKEQLLAELRNPGHKDWNPLDHPEWLLVEIESGIMIRDVQIRIAEQMRNPGLKRNAVMQLHMGEGKSSVIVPIVAAALADGSRLVRIVVDKPQSKQMELMLIAKLGGLLNRRVYFMPFSRSLKLSRSDAEKVATICRHCKYTGGVMIVQPEHILSFKLMTIECCATGRNEIGQSLLTTQNFFDAESRDIVDESDEIFSVRFEVIYTMGMQQPMEMSPDRWLLIQQVLDFVRDAAPEVAQAVSSSSLEVQQGVTGSFPRLRILRPNAESQILQRVARRICDEGLALLQLARQPEESRNALLTYISRLELDQAQVDAVQKSSLWTDATKPILLLLRGILAGGVLAFTLKSKRWRVGYGLASRTPPTQLAVPYRAKDCPSTRSEFSHPDVVLILTSLCYYYGGLTENNLFIAFGHLLQSDQAEIEYQAWIKDAHGLSPAFRQLQGINLKDRPQCSSELFPAFRYSKSVIDYFLTHLVFPKEMKEFPHKISASGWDIGKSSKKQYTTGFSGTNDSRCLLPTGVGYLDLPDQKHTNALVLEYLLQSENTVELLSAGLTSASAVSTASHAENLLTAVVLHQPRVRVILDVGAQILELDNLQLAMAWLSKVPPIETDTNLITEAVVFIGQADELSVVDRKGRVEPLHTSSYASRLDLCLIFLDEAHTRGIDLKLPLHYSAAVTLGPQLNKDRLVQACMRMRGLGKGQSVVFFVSEEIQSKISGLTAKPAAQISVQDILMWSISETQAEIRRSMPLWATQGVRHVKQEKLWSAASSISSTPPTKLSRVEAEKFLEVEARPLKDRYQPRIGTHRPECLNDRDRSLKQIAERCQDFEGLQYDSSTLQEEQERELSPEVEQEREVHRIPPAEPLQHRLRDDVVRFAETGVVLRYAEGYKLAFTALANTTAAYKLELAQLSGKEHLYATVDFASTVLKPTKAAKTFSVAGFLDSFQRQVQWVIVNRNNDLMIVSPFEANQLFERMKRSTKTSLCLYKPRTNSGYAPLDRLDLYTVSATRNTPIVPLELTVQLNLFAGQLYMSSHAEYLEICNFLGLATRAVSNKMARQGWKVDTEGFIVKDDRGNVGGDSNFKKSPINFFKILMSKIRRNGDSIAKTHMGSLLEGKLFLEADLKDVAKK